MIYLDYQATTPLAPEAAAAMRPWLDTNFANPHSPHRAGREAAAAVEIAREEVLETLFNERTAADDHPADCGQLFFTSGATEALNWAIKGTFARAGGRRRIVTIATEHAAVLDTVRWLEEGGAEIVMLPVDRTGVIDWREAHRAVDETTALVAAMYVNNEIGVVQHTGLQHLASAARAVGAPVICDNVQGFGRMSVPVTYCDMIALSAHKIHGPKGIGALWVRKRFEPEPLLHGGGQESGLRSGTLSPALCMGFGTAARIARERRQEDWTHVIDLYKRARRFLTAGGWHVNGSRTRRWPGNLNVWREGLDAGRLISELRDIAFSAGSACASGSGRPSHVLRAIGLSDRRARSSIRIGFGRYTTADELSLALQRIQEGAERQQSFAA